MYSLICLKTIVIYFGLFIQYLSSFFWRFCVSIHSPSNHALAFVELQYCNIVLSSDLADILHQIK